MPYYRYRFKKYEPDPVEFSYPPTIVLNTDVIGNSLSLTLEDGRRYSGTQDQFEAVAIGHEITHELDNAAARANPGSFDLTSGRTEEAMARLGGDAFAKRIGIPGIYSFNNLAGYQASLDSHPAMRADGNPVYDPNSGYYPVVPLNWYSPEVAMRFLTARNYKRLQAINKRSSCDEP